MKLKRHLSAMSGIKISSAFFLSFFLSFFRSFFLSFILSFFLSFFSFLRFGIAVLHGGAKSALWATRLVQPGKWRRQRPCQHNTAAPAAQQALAAARQHVPPPAGHGARAQAPPRRRRAAVQARPQRQDVPAGRKIRKKKKLKERI